MNIPKKKPPDPPPLCKAGQPYEEVEIEFLLLESQKPGARKLENRERLGRQLGRSAEAIDMVFRWCDDADFPERANNRIRRQVAAAKVRLGI